MSMKTVLLALTTLVLFSEQVFSQTTTPVPEEEVFTIVDEMPLWPGCDSISGSAERMNCTNLGMMTFVSKELFVPQMMEKSALVIVSFVIRKDGSVSDLLVTRSGGALADKEALRVVKKLPNWIPGKQEGKPVNVRYNLPINFVVK